LDREILLLITKGNPSTYSIWSALNKKLLGRGLAFINVKKRLRRLTELGLLQQTKPDTATAISRQRKDFIITAKGLERLLLMPDADIVGVKDAITITDYIEKIYQDNQLTPGILLFARFVTAYALYNAYCIYTGREELMPIKKAQIIDIANEFKHLTGQSKSQPLLEPRIETMITELSSSYAKLELMTRRKAAEDKSTLKSRARARFQDNTLIGIGEDGMFAIKDPEEVEYDLEEQERLQKANKNLKKRHKEEEEDMIPKASKPTRKKS
jgi:hypothetical protein